MAKVKIDSNLFARAKKVAQTTGYSSVEEFVVHLIEKELVRLEESDTDERAAEQLRGLGYID